MSFFRVGAKMRWASLSKVVRPNESYGSSFEMNILMASIQRLILELCLVLEEPRPQFIDPEMSKHTTEFNLLLGSLTSPSALLFKKRAR